VTNGEYTVNVAVTDRASAIWTWLPTVGVDADLSHVLDSTVMGRPANAGMFLYYTMVTRRIMRYCGMVCGQRQASNIEGRVRQ
jgi:hypothetical protein